MEVLLLRTHEDLLETSVVVDQALLGVAVALGQTKLVPYFLLFVGEEGASVTGEDLKSTVEVCQKRDVALELCTVMDKGAADSLKRGFLQRKLIVEFPI